VKRARLAAAALLFASFSFARVGFSQEAVATRQAQLSFDDKQTLRMSIAYRDVVDGEAASKLTGGLPTTIVMRAYVFRESGGAALAATFKVCRVIFDLWDEIYRIEITQTDTRDLVTASPTLEGVLRRCAETDRLPVAARALLLPPSKYYVAGIVEINPVSPDMLERIKRWVSRPSGTSTLNPGDALFGSFVGLFVARIGSAERQLTFRTQAFGL
jgi:hypothetical protein